MIWLVPLAAMAASLPQEKSAPQPRDPASWVKPDDYPAAALRAGERGTVEFTLAVAATGRVTDCRVTKSSGSTLLDQTTCAIMLRRARFSPARDVDGAAMPSTWSNRFNWESFG